MEKSADGRTDILKKDNSPICWKFNREAIQYELLEGGHTT
jgi:hypothetical protein